jgi:zinc transport system substrate-binding protein
MTKKTVNANLLSPGAILLAMLITAGGCGDRDEPSGAGKPELFVSVAPLAYFAERIAGEHITVNVLIGPGGNPHTFAPTPRQVVKLSRGGLLLCGGSDFGKIVASKLTWGSSQLKVVNLAEGLVEPHEHGDHGEDNHVWMSPKIARSLAAGICRELCLLDPPHSDDYRKNLTELHSDLDALDARLTKTMAPLKGKTFLVFHPAFGHFAEAYGLTQHAVEHEGKSPGPRHIAELIASAKAAKTKAIFVQPQFSRRAAGIIAKEIGCEIVVLDPLSPDYINNLEHIAKELQKALQP